MELVVALNKNFEQQQIQNLTLDLQVRSSMELVVALHKNFE
jgi:hypothetical protein